MLWCELMHLLISLLVLVRLTNVSTKAIRRSTSVDEEISPSRSHSSFFIYNWSKSFGDVYPPVNVQLDPETIYDHAFNDNGGAGKLLNAEIGLFQTWQFSLFQNIMSRLVVSRYRTRNPSQATAFVIPFDGGVHSFIDHENGRRRLASPHGWAAIRWLQDAQKNDKVFWRNQGHDHFFIFSLTEFVQTGIAVKEFFMGICQNCTVLTVEATPTLTSTLYHKTLKYWIPVPYPSSFHYHEGISLLPWSYDPNHNRNRLVLFIGSTFTLNIASNGFRKVLKSQCLGNSLNNSMQCDWVDVKHACNGIINSTDSMLLYRDANFCLSPPGDTITRKSIFDSILSGCIPVIFARASLSQYFWFLNKREIESISVYIPARGILSKQQNFVKYLQAIPLTEIRKKQQIISQIAPRLQYSIVPRAIREKVNISAAGGATSYYDEDEAFVTWDSPYRDSVDIIIDRMLNKSTVEPIRGFTKEELRMQKCLQHEIIQHHPDYAGLFRSGTKHLASSPKLYKKLNCTNISTPRVIFEPL